MKKYFFLALGNLKHRGARSWLTMLGIFIGIAAVVSLISLGQGLQDAITGQFATLDPDKLILENAGTGFGPPGSTTVKKLNAHDLDLVRDISGVEFAIPRFIRVGTIEFNKFSKFRTLTSIPEDSEELEIVKDSLNVEISEGKFLEARDRGKVVLGSEIANENSFGKKIRLGNRLKIQDEEFEVVGIMKKGGNFFINGAIFMSEEDLKNILKIEDEIDVIVVQVEDEDKIEEVAKDIERKFRKDRKLKLGEEDFSVQTPLQSISTINNVLNAINLVVVGIAAISLLIGGIGIANTMYTSVLERTREIGIMKAVGAKNKDILALFVLESAIFGLFGGIIGAILGLGLAFGVSELASGVLGGLDLKITLSFPLLIAAVSFSLLIGMLSGILPALQASRLNPVEALRK